MNLHLTHSYLLDMTLQLKHLTISVSMQLGHMNLTKFFLANESVPQLVHFIYIYLPLTLLNLL